MDIFVFRTTTVTFNVKMLLESMTHNNNIGLIIRIIITNYNDKQITNCFVKTANMYEYKTIFFILKFIQSVYRNRWLGCLCQAVSLPILGLNF